MSSLVTSAAPVNYDNNNNNDNIQNKSIQRKIKPIKIRRLIRKIKERMIENSYLATDDESSKSSRF